MEGAAVSAVAEVSTRVYVQVGRTATNGGRVVGGIVWRMSSNGTLGALMDSSRSEAQVSQGGLALVEGRARITLERGYLDMVKWIGDAGVHCVSCVKRSVRLLVLEGAEWQRDHHHQMRSLFSERVRERGRRYMAAKYAGILPASVAFCGAVSLLGWNYRNHLTHQRSYQMRFAVRTLCKEAPPGASTTADAAHQLSRQTRREALERWIRPVFQQLDTAHPRIAVITWPFGCGKSSLCRAAMREEGMAGVVVDVRVREDPLRSVIKALGVPHVEACGNALDFISEACCRAKSMMGGKTPGIVLRLREADSLARVCSEALALACERRMCHVVVEVQPEALSMAGAADWRRAGVYALVVMRERVAEPV